MPGLSNQVNSPDLSLEQDVQDMPGQSLKYFITFCCSVYNSRMNLFITLLCKANMEVYDVICLLLVTFSANVHWLFIWIAMKILNKKA